MKIKHLTILPILFFLPYFLSLDEDEPELEAVVETGIFLDTLENEVMLKMVNDQPQYFFAKIFTPVCNTGECLPVKVNIYWDLAGNYYQFDQPDGEILTKLDHEPFTKDDYELLDEILRGPDPRFAGQVKHHKMERDADQSSPGPEAVRVMTKYEMVDGITGSTLPEIEDKFVPGALYTTYTLWGLANDNSNKIREYTEENLMEPRYYYELLTVSAHNTSDMVIYHLTQEDGNAIDSRDKVLVALLDTGDVALQKVALNSFYWNSYETELVELALHNKFFGDATHDDIKRIILGKWTYNTISEGSMKMLSLNLHLNPNLMIEMMMVFSNLSEWPDQVFDNLTTYTDMLEVENQKLLIEMLKSQKEKLSNQQWKKVKQMEVQE